MCSVKGGGDSKKFTPLEVEQFYRNDFLTPVIVGLIGRDVVFSTLGIQTFDDRARIQDRIWEQQLAKYDHGYFSKEFCSLWYDSTTGDASYKVPLLFSNSFNVEQGLKSVHVGCS